MQNFMKTKHTMDKIREEFEDIDFDIQHGLSRAISNLGKNKYPNIQLNSDESISIFDDANNLDQDLMKLEYNSLTELLEEELKTKNYKKIDEKFDVLKKLRHKDTNLLEYKINLTPRVFDNILKSISTAYFYKGENSILNLYENKIPDTKETIKLFPVQSIDDNYIIRAAGCQLIEMPSIQLLKLMQNLLGRENVGELNANFHWIPKPLEEKFGIWRNDIFSTINKIFKDNNLSIDDKTINRSSDVFIFQTPNQDSKVKIDNIDDEKKRFYLKYGNIGEEELSQCKSLEVDTGYFLENLLNTLKERKSRFEKNENTSERSKELFNKLENTIGIFENIINDIKKESPNENLNLKNLKEEDKSQEKYSLSKNIS